MAIIDMSDEEAQRSAQLHEEYRSEAIEWIAHAWENIDVYLNKHWTDTQETQILARGQIPVCVPRITPIIRHKLAIATANRPGWRVVPQGRGDEQLAQINRALLYWIWNISLGDTEYADALERFFIIGRGCMRVYVDKLADDGLGEIKIENIYNPHEVLCDPNSRKRDWSDADNIIVSAVMTKERAVRMYPEYERIIKKQVGVNTDESTGAATSRMARGGQERPGDRDYKSEDKVRIIERYTKRVRFLLIKCPYQTTPLCPLIMYIQVHHIAWVIFIFSKTYN